MEVSIKQNINNENNNDDDFIKTRILNFTGIIKIEGYFRRDYKTKTLVNVSRHCYICKAYNKEYYGEYILLIFEDGNMQMYLPNKLYWDFTICDYLDHEIDIDYVVIKNCKIYIKIGYRSNNTRNFYYGHQGNYCSFEFHCPFFSLKNYKFYNYQVYYNNKGYHDNKYFKKRNLIKACIK